MALDTQSDGEILDVLIVGAGFTGIYMLHSARDKLGLKAKIVEAGHGVGGTWYWNRYPGARCDSPAHIYCFTFDRDLVQEWKWSERFPQQPEILRYLEHCADRFETRKDTDFGQFVNSTVYDDAAKLWTVTTDKGNVYKAKFVVAGTGCLTARHLPDIDGIDTFKGKSIHTSRWPEGGIDFTGKRVAVVGTGATAVQVIPLVSLQAKELTVFQRTPAYCVPARNGQVDPEVVKSRKENYDDIAENVRNSFFGFDFTFLEGSIFDATPEERKANFDAIWERGGFEFWLGNYADMFFSEDANKMVSDYIRDKIRSVVHDPVTAEKLVPKYAYGTKRNPLETNYYDTFNKDNVHLVDASTDGPLEEVNETGIRACGKDYEFDVIIYATGFDAMTGALKNMNVVGKNGLALNDLWADGPESYLGLTVSGFPNFFTVTGPQSPSAFSNVPVSIEQHVEFITEAIHHLHETGKSQIEPTPQAQKDWVQHVNDMINASIIPKTDSWYTGSNIPGKARKFLVYLDPAGVGGYRKRLEQVVENNYEGFELSA
ncbi:MAG: NAD(P)/FAD-dependent oxidoreductase [Pseudomonadota bacterium]